MGKRKLTRKELVEHIRKTMPTDFNEIEKLAFIENEIAKQISFDEQYLWGDRETKEKIYKLAKTEAQKPKKEIKRKLICITMSELYGYIAKEFGFEVLYQKRAPGVEDKTGDNDIFKKVSPKKQEHVCPIVKLSNGEYIEIDIQSDLYRLQTHSKPKAFGLSQVAIQNGVKTSTVDNNTIEKTFKKIYQLDENERFTDEYIMVFAAMLRCQHKTPIEMLEFFMNDPKIREALQNARCIEANKLYKKILSVCYDESNENQFFKARDKAIIEECILSDDKGQKRYSFCIYAKNEEQREFYVYSKCSRRMVNLTQEQVKQITQQAKDIKLRGRSSELKNQMIEFINGDGENIQPLRQEETTVSLDDIFLDEER
ncbi:MAG: hypothetical protein IJE68_02485 [Clostridia bacterium]|nr:hypothetical protein [Clostridia bacterium]